MAEVVFSDGNVPSRADIDRWVLEGRYALEITYWSRGWRPNGAPVARTMVSKGRAVFESLRREYDTAFHLRTLAPPEIGGATPGQPTHYVAALLRRYCGSYFWAGMRLMDSEEGSTASNSKDTASMLREKDHNALS